MGGRSGKQGIKEKSTTSFQEMSLTSLLTITHFKVGETEAQKGEVPEDIDSNPDSLGKDYFLL